MLLKSYPVGLQSWKKCGLILKAQFCTLPCEGCFSPDKVAENEYIATILVAFRRRFTHARLGEISGYASPFSDSLHMHQFLIQAITAPYMTIISL